MMYGSERVAARVHERVYACAFNSAERGTDRAFHEGGDRLASHLREAI